MEYSYEEYKDHLINYYVWECDKLGEKTAERRERIEKYGDDFLKSVVNKTIEVCRIILEKMKTENKVYERKIFSEFFVEEHSILIDTNCTGGHSPDRLYRFEGFDDNEFFSKYLLEKFLVNFNVFEGEHNVHREDDNIGNDYCFPVLNISAKLADFEKVYEMFLQKELKCRVVYDNKYLGPGYFIFFESKGELVQYIKFYSTGDAGFPIFAVRAWKKDSVDKEDKVFRTICFDFNSKNKELYDVICSFYLTSIGRPYRSAVPNEQGWSNMTIKRTKEIVSIEISKDIYGTKLSHSDNIDIVIGDNYSCSNYLALLDFWHDLQTVPRLESKEPDIKKLMLAIKRQ